MDRKKFIAIAGVVATSGYLSVFLAACKKNSSAPAAPPADFTLDLTASSNAVLLNPGGYLISNQVMVINNSGTYLALSDICTHQGCSLSYYSQAKQLQCPCHGGIFAIDGSVVSGPPPSSLKQYSVVKSGSILHVTG